MDSYATLLAVLFALGSASGYQFILAHELTTAVLLVIFGTSCSNREDSKIPPLGVVCVPI
jgi:hypothetical protein